MQTGSVASLTTTAGIYWQWRGQTIYYTKAGSRQEGKPALLLVHGFGASTDHWRKNIAQLQQDFEVWAIDLLGFGRSAKAKIEYSADLWRDQLYDFITNVIKKPVVLAGNSLGGYVSLCVAAQYPSSVAGLILLNSAGPFTEVQAPSKPSIIQNIIRYILLQSWASFFLFQFVRNRANIRKTLSKVYVDQSAITDQLVEDIYRPSCDPGAAQVFAAVFKNPHGEKVDVLLKRMQCPLLMLWGEGDPWMKSRERGIQYRQYYPNLTEYYLNAGHCPHDEVPDQVNQLIQNWMLTL
ncbi:alpha/beta fold hydrolase [Chroococcus sp. FPU101]|uniref:alpha/beta fold hydrolase n=1 Tax=Chroococcus sp. FPU101 TaxID=1974212 RepID=UPI001A901BB1|nr:alpha/beta fold hydrolase [Chroococcus sp. FPU101]GFE69791.1 alpha/beta hydrolase fold protein [Chroococcus sp. FPU101]